MTYLETKPLPESRKGSLCQCGKLATRLDPTIRQGRIAYIARCGACTHPSLNKNERRW